MIKYLVGVDLGTSSTKAALYRTDGTQVAEAAADVPLLYPRPGVVEQDTDDFYRTAAETVGRCLRELRRRLWHRLRTRPRDFLLPPKRPAAS